MEIIKNCFIHRTNLSIPSLLIINLLQKKPELNQSNTIFGRRTQVLGYVALNAIMEASEGSKREDKRMGLHIMLLLRKKTRKNEA